MIIIFSPKSFLWGKWTILVPKMADPLNSRSTVRYLKNFAEWKGLIGKWKLVFFQGKSFIWDNLIFLGHFLLFYWDGWNSVRPLFYWILSQDMIPFMITTGSLNSQDMIRILKQSRHDFSGNHLGVEYCMDIMRCLCVEIKIQQRVIWFCKAF